VAECLGDDEGVLVGEVEADLDDTFVGAGHAGRPVRSLPASVMMASTASRLWARVIVRSSVVRRPGRS
jgi:hypothetical protein